MSELLVVLDESTLTIVESGKRFEYPFPQVLLDFIDLDLLPIEDAFTEASKKMRQAKTKVDVFENKQAILKWLKDISKLHPFFLVQEYRVRAKFDEVREKELYNYWFDARGFQRKCTAFLKNCLNIDTIEDNTIGFNFKYLLSERGNIENSLESYLTNESYSNSKFTTNHEIIDDELREVLRPEFLNEVIVFCLCVLLNRRQAFKICKNCGKLFPVYSYKSAEYCERLFRDTGKPCKEIGAIRVYQEKSKDNPILLAYNKVYKRNFARVKYGRMTKSEFTLWSEWARGQRDRCLDGKMELGELLELLEY